MDQLAIRDRLSIHPVEIIRSRLSFQDLKSCWHIFQILKEVKPDIVHLSTPKAAIVGAVAAFMANVPIRLFFVRGLHTENKKKLARIFYRLAEKFTAKICNAWICVSPSLLMFARSEAILSKNQGMVMAKGMSNGVDTIRFDPTRVKNEMDVDWIRHSLGIPTGCQVIGFVGRLVQDKGLHELFECWDHVRKVYADVHLLLVGEWWDGPDAVNPEIRKRFERDDRVHIAGHVGDTAPYYSLMSFVVFPSHGTEGFPNVPMEAAAMALPVVASNVVGCVDAVVRGQTGFLVEPRDVTELTKAVCAYLDNSELITTHGKKARQRTTEDFQPQAIWQETYTEYLNLLRVHKLLPDRQNDRAP